jgi:hypothetical protein
MSNSTRFVILTDGNDAKIRVNADKIAVYSGSRNEFAKHDGTMLFEHIGEPTAEPSCLWVKESPKEVDAALGFLGVLIANANGEFVEV